MQRCTNAVASFTQTNISLSPPPISLSLSVSVSLSFILLHYPPLSLGYIVNYSQFGLAGHMGIGNALFFPSVVNTTQSQDIKHLINAVVFHTATKDQWAQHVGCEHGDCQVVDRGNCPKQTTRFPARGRLFKRWYLLWKRCGASAFFA